MKKNGAKKEFQVPSLLSEVQKTSERVLLFLKPLALTEALSFDIRLCLEEALINAMKYGNKLKADLKVKLEVEFVAGEIRITIEDQGEGFDHKNLKDCTRENNLLRNGGRGVYLIHQLMDQVAYNTKGNRLVMVKFLKNAASTFAKG